MTHRRWRHSPDANVVRKKQKPLSHPAKPKRLSGSELLQLSPKEASRLLKPASRRAAKDYEESGPLRIFEANDLFLD